uniref:sortase domain-containing protein n=1 Tax=uncultured Corynebacterium sp. TaxID=159447 RepID=UPI00345DCB1B
DSMPYALPLNPAGPQSTMVRWVDGWGVSPKDAEKGTMYVLGHAWGAAPLVFNPLSEAVTADVDLNAPPKYVNGTDGKPVKRYSSDVLNGAKIKMRDGANHQRTWKVTRSWLVDKNEAIVDPDIMDDKRPGRIVLIACSVSGSNDLGYNVIVEGELV